MRIRFRRLLSGLLLVLSAVGLNAQDNGLVNISFDPEADSLYFAKVRSYLNEIRKERPTVALVLAGGGAKGAAHIGVLKYLEEKGMPIDFVAGTSMGALMGGLYAMGYSAGEIDSIVRSIDWNMMMSDNIPMDFYSYKRKTYKNTYVLDVPFTGAEFLRSLPSGFVYGLNIYNMLSALSVGYQEEGMDFMNMPTPYCCVATEIVSQKEKHWTSGPLIEAMRSTMSIPGYFMPVQVDSLLFSDGGTKNNFPTDIAKAVGADIIIGVEMTLPRDYAKVNNIAEVLMQTLQYSGGLEAHNQNVKNATVYITPDISGFGMLSFGTEEVSTLISRGYHEAIKHTREIDSIIRMVGNGGRELHNKPSINTALTKVKVTSVGYEGIESQEMQYLDDKIRLKVDEYYGREDFELAQSIIFGTMVFTHVTYRLENDGNGGYKLVFHCVKRPANSIGVGLRADSEEWLGMILNGGFGSNKLFGSTVDVTLRLSLSPYLKVDWYYMPKRGPKFGAYLKTQYRTQLGTVGNEFNYSYYKQSWQNEVRAYIAGTTWSQVDLNGGVRVEAMPFYQQIGETPDPVYRKHWDWKDIHPYAYIRFVYDHEDARYFPEKGFRVKVAYDYNFKKTHYVAAGLHGVIPICSFFSIVASLNGRYILGEDYLENMNMRNYVGGAMAGRYYEHQIPFVAINGERSCDRLLSTVDMDLRFKIAKKYFVSLVAAAMHDGNSIENYREKYLIYGAALQFGYKSKFGPLMANIHWSSFDKKVGVYFSAGYDF